MTQEGTAILNEIDESVAEVNQLVAPLSEDAVNETPAAGGWSAAQVLRHLIKSTARMGSVMHTDAPMPDRDPRARFPELDKTFKDYTTKLKSPEFIIPEPGPYRKQEVLDAFNDSFQRLKEATNAQDDLSGMLAGLPLGPVTKIELLHFVSIHLKRHVHQLRNITQAIANRE